MAEESHKQQPQQQPHLARAGRLAVPLQIAAIRVGGFESFACGLKMIGERQLILLRKHRRLMFGGQSAPQRGGAVEVALRDMTTNCRDEGGRRFDGGLTWGRGWPRSGRHLREHLPAMAMFQQCHCIGSIPFEHGGGQEGQRCAEPPQIAADVRGVGRSGVAKPDPADQIERDPDGDDEECRCHPKRDEKEDDQHADAAPRKEYEESADQGADRAAGADDGVLRGGNVRQSRHDAAHQHEDREPDASHSALNGTAEDPETHHVEAEVQQPPERMLCAAHERVVVGELVGNDLPPVKVAGGECQPTDEPFGCLLIQGPDNQYGEIGQHHQHDERLGHHWAAVTGQIGAEKDEHRPSVLSVRIEIATPLHQRLCCTIRGPAWRVLRQGGGHISDERSTPDGRCNRHDDDGQGARSYDHW